MPVRPVGELGTTPRRRRNRRDERSRGDTRRQLLESAAECFAEKGFRDTTIRDVCARAGANIAAINYHFAGKLALYREVFRETSASSLEAHPLTGLPSDDPRDDLRRFILTMVARLSDSARGARHAKLMAREMVEPTRVLDEVVEGVIRPHLQLLEGIVARVLGPGQRPGSPRVRAAARAIIAQILIFRNCRAVLERLHPGDTSTRRMHDRAQEVAEFSLAALDGLRAAPRPEPAP